MREPITPADGIRLCAVIAAHWPAPRFTPDDEAQLTAALNTARVSLSQAQQAIQALIVSGEAWQPRAPRIIAMHRERRAHREGMVSAPQLTAHASMPDAEVDARIEDVGDPRIRALAQQAVANLRAKTRMP